MAGPDLGVIAAAIELACRAPSLHNSQPWRWVVCKSGVHLYADRERVVRSTDDTGREALISCGAALDHFRIAMAASGWHTTVERFPESHRCDHLAVVRFTRTDEVAQVHIDRAGTILRRRTDRLPFRDPPDWEFTEAALRDCIEDSWAYLDVLPDDATGALVEAARLAEELRHHDDLYHRELLWWTAPFRLAEGLPPSALLSASENRRVPVNRSFRLSGHGDRRLATAVDQARILVLSTLGDTAEEALRSGEILSTVLLECTMAGLATCTVTHVTELAASRAIVRGLTSRKGMPQVLIRVGLAPSIETVPAPTPRRSVREVMEVRSDHG